VFYPNLLVIADESLVGDPQARVLDGITPETIALVNSPTKQDLTALALRHTRSTSALSVALGAAAAKLSGIEKHFVEEAVREELVTLGLSKGSLEKNVKLAIESFDLVIDQHHPGASIDASPCRARPSGRHPSSSEEGSYLVTPTYAGGWRGTASVASAPNTPSRKTGDWRVMRPVIDLERCTHCWVCFENCPDGAITLTESDIPQIDYGVCKGCLICGEECPIHAIKSIRETECRS
jgi:pyruvate ferredoxin oxidoreductase gamma subunit